MHNRNLIWKTRDNRKLKIGKMTSLHISNTINFIKKNIDAYNQKFGEDKVKEYLYCFKQEIRYRKLNRLNLGDETDELF